MQSTRQKVYPLGKDNSALDIADVLGSAFKSEALSWRFTGDTTDAQNISDRIDMLYKFHGRASGTYCWIWPFARSRTLCYRVSLVAGGHVSISLTNEILGSRYFLYPIFGNNSFADRVEKPGSVLFKARSAWSHNNVSIKCSPCSTYARLELWVFPNHQSHIAYSLLASKSDLCSSHGFTPLDQ